MNFIIQIRLKEEVAIKSAPFSQLRLVRKRKNENKESQRRHHSGTDLFMKYLNSAVYNKEYCAVYNKE